MKFPSAGPDSHPGTSVVFLEGGFHHWFYYFMVLYCTGFTFPRPPSPRSSISLCHLTTFPANPVVTASWVKLDQSLLDLFYFIFLKFILFLLAALGFRCCAWAFSSCGEQGLLFVAVHGLLIVVSSLVADHRL